MTEEIKIERFWRFPADDLMLLTIFAALNERNGGHHPERPRLQGVPIDREERHAVPPPEVGMVAPGVSPTRDLAKRVSAPLASTDELLESFDPLIQEARHSRPLASLRSDLRHNVT